MKDSKLKPIQTLDDIPVEWIKDYLKRSKDNYISGVYGIIHPEHGFMTYDVDIDKLILHCVYGNGNYWYDVAIDLAKQLGLPKLLFATQRNWRAFERKYGARLVGYVMEIDVK